MRFDLETLSGASLGNREAIEGVWTPIGGAGMATKENGLDRSRERVSLLSRLLFQCPLPGRSLSGE